MREEANRNRARNTFPLILVCKRVRPFITYPPGKQIMLTPAAFGKQLRIIQMLKILPKVRCEASFVLPR